MDVSQQIKHKTVFRLTGKCCQKCHPSHKCSTHGSAFLFLQTNMARYISVTGKCSNNKHHCSSELHKSGIAQRQ